MSTAVTVEAISTDMSVSMWPASTSSASDPVTMALTASAMNTVEVSPNDIMSLFLVFGPACGGRGVHTRMAVCHDGFPFVVFGSIRGY